MSRLRAVFRAAAIGSMAVVLAPVQVLAVRWRWRLAESIPLLFHRAALRLIGLRIRVRGTAPRAGPVLIVANHVSWLDIPVVGSLVPGRFVARADMLGWPGISILARLQRSVFVDRTRRTATGVALRAVRESLEQRGIVVLFPEGTTSDGSRVLPFRSALLGVVQQGSVSLAGEPLVVQPMTIAYRARDGLPLDRATRPAVAWYGDMTLGAHLWAVLAGGPIDVEVIWGPPLVCDAATDRKSVARALAASVRAEHTAAVTGRRDPRAALAHFQTTPNRVNEWSGALSPVHAETP